MTIRAGAVCYRCGMTYAQVVKERAEQRKRERLGRAPFLLRTPRIPCVAGKPHDWSGYATPIS